LAPERGAHQPVGEPRTGLAQPGLTSFEPACADELAVLLRWAFEEIQREAGKSIYFRLSTRPIEQLQRVIDPDLAEAIVAGAYWLLEPGPDT
jgi:pyruvate dehydrogenase E1 component